MNEKNSRLGLSDRLARYKDPEINKEKKAENEPRMKKTIKKTIRQNMDRRSPFPMTRSVKGLRKETMPMLPRERLMVMRSRWLQKEERLRRWDDSVKVTSNFVHKQKKNILFITPAYVTMPFPVHPAPTTDPCMDSSLANKVATAMYPSWAPALE